MPSRNIIREYAVDNYYHVYNRGVEKRVIFLDEQDYTVFIGLLKKYLAGENHNKNNRHSYKKLDQQVELLAYCLMPNHFHLLFYQTTASGISQLMQRLVTGYVMYFNHKYHRVGALFQSRYKASRINANAYLQHISRYIHMNPAAYLTWPYSSLKYFLSSQAPPGWLNTARTMELFGDDRGAYKDFLSSYEDTKAELAVLKWQLADNPDDM